MITLTFENTGIYTYDKFRVVCQPVQGIQEKAQELGAETLQNINQEENQITGEITVSGKRALVLAIPYSKGFTAYVDGEKAELKKAKYHVYGKWELGRGTSYNTAYLLYSLYKNRSSTYLGGAPFIFHIGI